MYSDLFDALGRQQQRQHQQQQPLSPPPILTCKAGKLDLALQENGKYWVTPDLRRGEIQLVWKDDVSQLYWEWYDRRDKVTVGSFPLEAGSTSTFERVDTGREQDRVYLWKQNDNYHMYWLQEGTSAELDDEIVAQINQYLSNPTEAAPATSHRIATATATSAPLTSSASPSQVDALSNILENLGMLQQQQQLQEETATTSNGAIAAGTNEATSARSNNRSIASTPAGRLTLADLQGAMAALQQPTASVALQDVVTSDAVNTLLQDEAVQHRLLELLPEEQRSLDHLQENLRSPQLQQTLRSLTTALHADPDTGSLDGYHSLVANFSLPQGEQALVANSGNPVLAFLDCILASVSQQQQGEEEQKEEEKTGDDGERKEPENDNETGDGSMEE